MAANSSSPAFENFQLFGSAEDEKPNPGLGLGFLDSQQPPLPPPPPCLEVLSSEVSSSAKYNVEPVSVGGLTMLKGRVSTQEVFSLSNSDLVPGKYEGGLKLWEGALDLVKALCGEVENGHLSFSGKRVLEVLTCKELDYFVCLIFLVWDCFLFLMFVGKDFSMPILRCNLSNILDSGYCKGKFLLDKHKIYFSSSLTFASMLSAWMWSWSSWYLCMPGAAVHFQDFNAEVLRCLTIPNVTANLSKMAEALSTNPTESDAGSAVRYFAGDWSEMHKILPFASDNEEKLSGSFDGYDIVLMAETVYSLSTLKTLYKLITQCLSRPHGVVYLAGKKHYFGVGGGTRRFLSVIEKEGEMVSQLIAEVADGSSNVREVWKLSLK